MAGRGAGVGGCWLAPQMSLGERMADFDSQFVGWSGYKEALGRIFFPFLFWNDGAAAINCGGEKK